MSMRLLRSPHRLPLSLTILYRLVSQLLVEQRKWTLTENDYLQFAFSYLGLDCLCLCRELNHHH